MQQIPLSRRKFLAASGVGALGALTSGFPPLFARSRDPLTMTDKQTALVNGINTFATDIYTRLARAEKGNLFLSPFSIEAALAMTAGGARGKTLEEMEKVLHLPKDAHAAFGELITHFNSPYTPLQKPDEDPPPISVKAVERAYQLKIANAIWAQKNFPWEKEFINLTRKHYGAGMMEVNFAETEAARKEINEWVAKETKEKIKELIPEGIITALTVMVLCNAIYFKSNWLYQFDKKLTKDAPFTRGNATKVDVPLMTLTGKLHYGEQHIFQLRRGEPIQILELPYAGKELSMLVYLPESPDTMSRLAESLTPEALVRPALEETDVKVFLPRFKAESFFSLKEPLMEMGMTLAFTTADFTGMSPKGKELYITHVLHKAFVDVNEEGTEAAAATAVVIGRKSEPPPPKEFRADRPFVYVIRDNTTGTALFMGRYMGPNT